MRQLHREVQDAMVQLEAIRHEIRGVGSLASSRALARGLAGDSGSPDRAAFAHAEHSQAGPAAIGRPEVPKIKAEAPGRSLGHRPEQPSAAPPLDVLPMSAVSAGLLPRRYGEPGEQAGHRLDVMPSGADILSDAIVERQVAWQAYEFLRRSRGS
eukprot:SM000013S26486  [mRNA]  locus=s13:651980:652599:- [translate_table: standard]